MNRKFKRYLRLLVEYITERAFEEKGWTEDELADKAQLSPSTVYKLRTGRTQDPRMKTLWKLCQAVGIDWTTVTDEMTEILAGYA